MGEMADYYLDQCLDSEDHISYHIYDKNEEYGISYIPRPAEKTCRYCNKSGLRWGQHNGKFRLFDGNVMHECKALSNKLNKRDKNRDTCSSWPVIPELKKKTLQAKIDLYSLLVNLDKKLMTDSEINTMRELSKDPDIKKYNYDFYKRG